MQLDIGLSSSREPVINCKIVHCARGLVGSLPWEHLSFAMSKYTQ